MWQRVLYFSTNVIEVDVILSALLVLALHQTRADDCSHQSFSFSHIIKASFIGLCGNQRLIFLFQNYMKSNANVLWL